LLLTRRLPPCRSCPPPPPLVTAVIAGATTTTKMSTSDINLVKRWFIHRRGEVEDDSLNGKVIYSYWVGVSDNWQGQRQWAAMKATAATAMVVGTDNNQLKGPVEKTLAAATVTAAEKAMAK
jgi:hypothetical protein